MTIRTHITRLAKAVSLVLALVALAVPAAQAGDIAVDDYFRDGTIASEQLRATDGAFERAVLARLRNANSSHAAPSANVLVDDWFRDNHRVAIDARGSGTGSATPSRRNVLGDDWFRDSHRVATPQSSSGGVAWDDFGIGAGSMLGGLVLLAGVSSALLVVRRGSRALGRT